MRGTSPAEEDDLDAFIGDQMKDAKFRIYLTDPEDPDTTDKVYLA